MQVCLHLHVLINNASANVEGGVAIAYNRNGNTIMQVLIVNPYQSYYFHYFQVFWLCLEYVERPRPVPPLAGAGIRLFAVLPW